VLCHFRDPALDVIDTISALMLEIDEAWLKHTERLAPGDEVKLAEVELENPFPRRRMA
jgi:hypothetical protein